MEKGNVLNYCPRITSNWPTLPDYDRLSAGPAVVTIESVGTYQIGRTATQTLIQLTLTRITPYLLQAMYTYFSVLETDARLVLC